MKKMIFVLMAAGVITACNNDAATDGDVKDSVQKTIDSIGDARVDSVKEATDSLQQKVENTFSATDSANKVIADSASKKQ